jgi:L-ascorbate metabolism protein UlaG (beta-lactamase superfamily)
MATTPVTPHVLELAPPERAADLGHGEVTFIGTATVLLRYGGFTILTDPNFLHAGEHAYLGLGLRSERLTDPAIELADLPPLDLVVLSHHHGDHFDQVVARDLDKDLPIVTEPHSAKKLTSQGFRRPLPLETWQSQVVRKGGVTLRITSMPGKHAPQPLGALLPPVMGSMLEFEDADGVALRLYVTGDTLVHGRLAEIPQRYPDIDLCLIHLGGTRVGGILLTMDAAQGVEALQLVRPRAAIPIHYDDYGVFKSPLADFLAAAERASLSTVVHAVARGETHRFTRSRR